VTFTFERVKSGGNNKKKKGRSFHSKGKVHDGRRGENIFKKWSAKDKVSTHFGKGGEKALVRIKVSRRGNLLGKRNLQGGRRAIQAKETFNEREF